MAYGLLRLLEGPNRPTGFFCSTDMLALRVIKILREAGLEVPRDASVVGFDGIETGRLISPALTTIAQPGRLLGERAIGMLQHQISALRPAPPQSCLLPFELVMRETVGECPPCP